jgi:hypothetical protein
MHQVERCAISRRRLWGMGRNIRLLTGAEDRANREDSCGGTASTKSREWPNSAGATSAEHPDRSPATAGRRGPERVGCWREDRSEAVIRPVHTMSYL